MLNTYNSTSLILTRPPTNLLTKWSWHLWNNVCFCCNQTKKCHNYLNPRQHCRAFVVVFVTNIVVTFWSLTCCNMISAHQLYEWHFRKPAAFFNFTYFSCYESATQLGRQRNTPTGLSISVWNVLNCPFIILSWRHRCIWKRKCSYPVCIHSVQSLCTVRGFVN